MDRPWIFLINPIMTATRNSYRAMKKIGDYSMSALGVNAGDPFFDTLIANLSPSSDNFNTNYVAWEGSKGTQKGQSGGLNNLFKILSGEKAEDWDIATQQFTGKIPLNILRCSRVIAPHFRLAARKTA